MEERVKIFKRASTAIVDRNIILNALQECRTQFKTFPVENLEDDLMSDMMPCLQNLFLKIYADNEKIDSVERVEELIDNLTITISLTEYVEDLLDFVSTEIENASFKLFKSIIREIPKCIYLTYKHCKENQKKYQNFKSDCKEILLLYKMNQECHTKFLNVMSNLSIDVEDHTSTYILIEAIQSASNIIEILLGLNIKALADSWKSYWCIIEKHVEILEAQKFYCIREIDLLESQIKNFMDTALESNDEKQVVQYTKISGFLLKISLKIVDKFWQNLYIDHLENIYDLVCSIYSYLPDFLFKKPLGVDAKKSIESCLLDVITSFVEEKFLCEDTLDQILSYMTGTKKDSIGVLALNLEILKFATDQPPDSVDSSFFNGVVNLIFTNFTLFFPETDTEDTLQIPGKLIEKISSNICQSITIHNGFYNLDFESVLISNILGNHVGCHFLASTIWIEIVSQASTASKKEFISDILELIRCIQVDLAFNSSKVILLKMFMQKLFRVLSDDEKLYFLKLHPPVENIHLWKIIGLHHIFGNANSFSSSLTEFISTNLRDMKSLSSVDNVITSVEMLKLLADNSNCSSENKKILTDIVKNVWESNLDVVNCDNAFWKYFISSLSEATIRLMKCFSNDQIISILKKLETLATSSFIKLKLCFILSEILMRKTEHNMEQNKLNFVISDLLELLLKEKDKTINNISLKLFQQFAGNGQHIIINNVSRMLPDMNLENYIRNNKEKICLHDLFKLFDLKSIDHKCLYETRKSNSASNSFESVNRNLSRENSVDSLNEKSLSRQGSFETRNESPIFVNKPSVEFKRISNPSNVTSQCKRIKLGNEVQEEDDTINEVLQRIKSEIKCLNKVLNKEKPTPKNAQQIRMLACQLQNVLDG